MPMPADILEQVKADFPAADIPSVLTRLESASRSERVLRCIVFAARGHPWYFDFLTGPAPLLEPAKAVRRL